MSRLLRLTTAGAGRAPATRTADRWTIWSRALSAQHTRSAVWRGGLPLLVVRPHLPAVERWQSFAVNLMPNIQLAIQPLLREMSARMTAFPAGDWIRMIKDARDQATQFAPAQSTVPGSLAASFSKSAASSFVFAQAPGTHATMVQPGFGAASGPAPVLQSFRRIEGYDRQGFSRPGPVTYQSVDDARRVVAQHRRIEERSSRTAVVHADKRFNEAELERVIEKRLHLRETPSAAPHTNARKSAASVSPAALPELNLEQLTERVVQQIDQRMVAFRERVGRVF